ncbi:O-antigen ligase domain-containing protein [Isosphaeraceae bacterium EP7]
MSWQLRLRNGIDRALAVSIATMVLGSALAFGGAVWWARPVLAALAVLIAALMVARGTLEGRMRMLKSPLAGLGLLAIGLAVLQLVPLPASIAGKVSSRSHDAYARGLLSDVVLADDPEAVLPEPSTLRSAVSVDRAATLRWAVGAMTCLCLFWAVSHFADRLQRLNLVWGAVVWAFYLNTALALVQLGGQSSGLLGTFGPGSGRSWAPTADDLLSVPNQTHFRVLSDERVGQAAWGVDRPERPMNLGTLMGGPGAFLALAALGLPLALGMTLQSMAPRGSRETLLSRLDTSGQGGFVLLGTVLGLGGAVLIGAIAGPLLVLPFVLSVLLVGLPAAWPSGLRWSALGATSLVVVALAGGVKLGESSLMPEAARSWVARDGWHDTSVLWKEAARIGRDFPLMGAGMGTFPTVLPLYKEADAATTTAQSSLLRLWAEAGLAGIGLAGIAALWGLIKLPAAIRRVGSADRVLSTSLVGATVGFGVFSAVHWSVETTAVAMAASALGGTLNRWLAGATDLFIERD